MQVIVFSSFRTCCLIWAVRFVLSLLCWNIPLLPNSWRPSSVHTMVPSLQHLLKSCSSVSPHSPPQIHCLVSAFILTWFTANMLDLSWAEQIYLDLLWLKNVFISKVLHSKWGVFWTHGWRYAIFFTLSELLQKNILSMKLSPICFFLELYVGHLHVSFS